MKYLTPAYIHTEPKKKLSRDLNGTISTFAFINSFYSYLLLHNDWKSIHQSSCTVWKSLISFDISVSFEVGVDFLFFRNEYAHREVLFCESFFFGSVYM